jgi:hypothetical protein
MKISLLFILFLTSSIIGWGQIPSKAKKLAGTWEYKEGSGLETWELVADKLVGSGYRVNRKTLDTTIVEEMLIHKPGKHLLYFTETYGVVVGGARISREQNFVADRRKMKFFNVGNHPPYAVEYKFGFFSKKKLKVLVYHGPHDKPLKLILYKRE